MAYSTLEQIKIRLRMYTVETVGGESVLTFNKPEENFIIDELIKKAKNDIIAYRHYPDYYTQEQIDEDIEMKYHNTLVDLVLYDYSVDGANYETSHNENGVNRTFVKRESILGKIIPFCKVL